MRKSFKLPAVTGIRHLSGAGAWLRIAAAILAAANVIALLLFISPPGGSQTELSDQRIQLQRQVATTRANSGRLRSVASKVQLGSTESSDFEAKYFLPRRMAYKSLLAELQRMESASGLQERDRAYSEEPIEGTADLTLVNVTANYQGAYSTLMKFLSEVDKSPMLLMLDTLQATPQQGSGLLNSALRLQVIIREDGTLMAGGQQ